MKYLMVLMLFLAECTPCTPSYRDEGIKVAEKYCKCNNSSVSSVHFHTRDSLTAHCKDGTLQYMGTDEFINCD